MVFIFIFIYSVLGKLTAVFYYTVFLFHYDVEGKKHYMNELYLLTYLQCEVQYISDLQFLYKKNITIGLCNVVDLINILTFNNKPKIIEHLFYR